MFYSSDSKIEAEINSRIVKRIKQAFSTKELFVRNIDSGLNSFQQAEKNIEWCFNNFEHIFVATSGGKDSSVLLDMCLKEAERQDRYVNLCYFDEEFELTSSVELVKWQMELPRVIKHWICPPVRMDCAYRKDKPFVDIWVKDRQWYHQPPSYAVFDNFGATSWGKAYGNYYKMKLKELGGSAIFLNGMTAQESLTRLKVLKTTHYYFGQSWITHLSPYISASPLADMKVKDIWVYVALNGLKMNDYYGKAMILRNNIQNIRVSSLLHENTMRDKDILQNIYPDDYNRLIEMLGITTNDCVEVGAEITKKPAHFATWYDYFLFILNTMGLEYKDEWEKIFMQTLNGVIVGTPRERVEYVSRNLISRIYTGDIKGATSTAQNKTNSEILDFIRSLS